MGEGAGARGEKGECRPRTGAGEARPGKESRARLAVRREGGAQGPERRKGERRAEIAGPGSWWGRGRDPDLREAGEGGEAISPGGKDKDPLPSPKPVCGEGSSRELFLPSDRRREGAVASRTALGLPSPHAQGRPLPHPAQPLFLSLSAAALKGQPGRGGCVSSSAVGAHVGTIVRGQVCLWCNRAPGGCTPPWAARPYPPGQAGPEGEWET